jgi:type VI secretion system FHA domain protein
MSDFGDEFIAPPSIRPAPPPPPQPPVALTTPPSPLQSGPGDGFAGTPAPVAPPMPTPAAASPLVLAPAQPAPHPAARPDAATGQGFVRAFCEGAEISADAIAKLAPEEFARELGRTMRVVATEMMALLQDRATTKRFTKGGERTMIGAKNNNPLKFLPDAKQALEVMFVAPRDGFLKGGDGVVAGMADIRRHQMAVFAAMQPALAKLLSDLAPESIDDGSGGGLLGGGANKKKAWDTFVERWDAKAGAHENGMLDVFLQHFAESYAAAVAAAGKAPGKVD